MLSDGLTQEDVLGFYGYDLSDYDIYYADSAHGYSWSALLIIFRHEGKLFAVDDMDEWNPYEVSEEEAIELMLDFEEAKDYG